jgi:carbamoyltransferase
MIVLGMSGGTQIGNQDAAAALLVDGRIVAASEEERFVGVKFANGYLPGHAIAACLRDAKIAIQDVDAVVFAGATYVDIEATLRRYFMHHFGHAPPIHLVDHHTAHAASAWLGGGGDDGLIVTWDNSGDGRSTTLWDARDGRMTLIDEYRRPNSLGLYYGVVTQFLGFLRDSDEYKVMGMSAYGQPRFDFDSILQIDGDGYRFLADFLTGIVPGRPQPAKHVCLFDDFPLPTPPRRTREEFRQEHFDVAASAQAQLERICLHVIRRALAKTGHRRLYLAGGVALNCLMNQKIREMPELDTLFVPPVSSDAGLALGAAYLVARDQGDRVEPIAHAYLGPSYSDADIQRVLDRAMVSYRRSDDPAEDAARLIAEGKIVGWFQGRLEYGPRALGSRSILANPRVADMKDQINLRVKFREEYRPLAPAVLHERGPDFFEGYVDSPFMTQTFGVRGDLASVAPAVVHADGTSRLQSVHAQHNPLFDRLIRSLNNKNGLPIVLNTSLNAYNDPMACMPHQALRTYTATGMDALVMGGFVLEKRPKR